MDVPKLHCNVFELLFNAISIFALINDIIRGSFPCRHAHLTAAGPASGDQPAERGPRGVQPAVGHLCM